jgi:hypothetical protein
MKMPWSRKKTADSATDPARLQAEAYVSELAWEAIAPGFQDKEDIIESISEMADDDDALALTGAEAAAMVEELWQKRRLELQQPSDRDPSDDARVAAAFAELENSGVVARMNLGYDQGEGSDEARAIAKAAGARGFVYFHIQDANRLAYPNATLFLGWDAVGTSRDEYDAATIHLGEEIRAALERQGLAVGWDGTLATRPGVLNLNWRKPLPS